MSPGAVLYFEQFEFSDGSVRNKYALILNACERTDKYLYILSTSVEKRGRTQSHGCDVSSESFFIGPVDGILPKNSWFMLDKVYEEDQSQVLQKGILEHKVYRGLLNYQMVRAIINCLLKVPSTEGYKKVILKYTLDNHLQPVKK